MKIRTGFVSNSSSSSFCIIGIQNEKTVFELMKKEGFPIIIEKEKVSRFENGGYGKLKNRKKYEEQVAKAKNIEVLDLHAMGGGYGFWEKRDGKATNLIYLGGEQPEYAGLNGEALLKNKSITEAKKYFKEYVKNTLNIDIPDEQIGFYYGEVQG
jgi:hypothetical protein